MRSAVASTRCTSASPPPARDQPGLGFGVGHAQQRFGQPQQGHAFGTGQRKRREQVLRRQPPGVGAAYLVDEAQRAAPGGVAHGLGRGQCEQPLDGRAFVRVGIVQVGQREEAVLQGRVLNHCFFDSLEPALC
jgi:hypothetical protein